VWEHSLGSDQGGRSEIAEDCSNDTEEVWPNWRHRQHLVGLWQNVTL
jgi:hypothetical protein